MELARNLNLDSQCKDWTFEEMVNEAANLCALFLGSSMLGDDALGCSLPTFIHSDELNI
jgi:hypothetical protein